MPSAPLNVTLVRVADSLVKLKWEEPESPNGIIKGYHVYILNLSTNATDVKKVINPQRSMEFTANNLSMLYFLCQLILLINGLSSFPDTLRAIHGLQDLGEGLHLETRGRSQSHH